LQPQLAAQVDALYQAVCEHFPTDSRSSKPKGGYALWVQLPASIDAIDIYRSAQGAGINIVPGVVFSADLKYRNCLRLNAGNPWSPVLEKAVRDLATLVEQHRLN